MAQPFKCPSCGGPLEYDGGDITIRCPYCTNSIIVPEELRAAPPFNGAQVFNGAGVTLPAQLLKLAEIGQMIRAGNKIAAIKLYREAFGMGLKEAKEAVENLAAGRAVQVSRTFETGGNVMLHPQQIPNWPAPQAQAPPRAKGCSPLAWIGVIIVIFFVFIGGIVSLALRAAHSFTMPTMPGVTSRSGTREAKSTSSGFAAVSLEFGSEGIGAGQFKDARSIAVDGKGRIYVGEYTGGRVQVFDADGQFLTQWTVDPKAPLLQLAADRQGTVYVVQGGDISRYEGMTGQLLGKLAKAAGSGFTSDVALAMDGGMVAIEHGEDIIRLDGAGRVMRAIKAAISEQSGNSELSTRVAVDGLGNIYAMGRFNNAVFKFGPNGKYLTRFGGKGNQPGQFNSLHAIAVDGQGRIFVGESRGIQVFDENGRYIDTFKLEQNLPLGMVFNDKGELFVAARNKVYKFVVNKP
jgi:streptogramin lyase/DNA-directed RNA polymerase subunit RPC12/RpoP